MSEKDNIDKEEMIDHFNKSQGDDSNKKEPIDKGPTMPFQTKIEKHNEDKKINGNDSSKIDEIIEEIDTQEKEQNADKKVNKTTIKAKEEVEIQPEKEVSTKQQQQEQESKISRSEEAEQLKAQQLQVKAEEQRKEDALIVKLEKSNSEKTYKNDMKDKSKSLEVKVDRSEYENSLKSDIAEMKKSINIKDLSNVEGGLKGREAIEQANLNIKFKNAAKAAEEANKLSEIAAEEKAQLYKRHGYQDASKDYSTKLTWDMETRQVDRSQSTISTWDYIKNNDDKFLTSDIFKEKSDIPDDYIMKHGQNHDLSKILLKRDDISCKTLSGVIDSCSASDVLKMCKYQTLNEEFLNYEIDKPNSKINLLHLKAISANQTLNEEFMDKRIDILDGRSLSINQELSETFISKHLDKLDAKEILKHQDINGVFREHIEKTVNELESIGRDKIGVELYKNSDNIDWKAIADNENTPAELSKSLNVLLERDTFDKDIKTFISTVGKEGTEELNQSRNNIIEQRIELENKYNETIKDLDSIKTYNDVKINMKLENKELTNKEATFLKEKSILEIGELKQSLKDEIKSTNNLETGDVYNNIIKTNPSRAEMMDTRIDNVKSHMKYINETQKLDVKIEKETSRINFEFNERNSELEINVKSGQVSKEFAEDIKVLNSNYKDSELNPIIEEINSKREILKQSSSIVESETMITTAQGNILNQAVVQEVVQDNIVEANNETITSSHNSITVFGTVEKNSVLEIADSNINVTETETVSETETETETETEVFEN
jgi:hypothetical protein